MGKFKNGIRAVGAGPQKQLVKETAIPNPLAIHFGRESTGGGIRPESYMKENL